MSPAPGSQSLAPGVIMPYRSLDEIAIADVAFEEVWESPEKMFSTAADAALNAVLGGPKIYDEPPRAAAFPYVPLGETRVNDYSTGDGPGEEHQLTLHAWSRQGGTREAHLIAGTLLAALDDALAADVRKAIEDFKAIGS